MLRLIMMNMIMVMSHADLLSQYNWIGLFCKHPKSCKRNFSHNPSQIPSANLLSSAYPLERATTFCFLLLHVTRLSPTKVKYLEVDHLSPLSPALSASVYTSMVCSPVFLENKIHFPRADFRYLKMCMTTFICCSPGLCINCLTILNAYATSGLVCARYINLLISLWHLHLSTRTW